ncbi:NUDIX hydrolase [Microbacterium betulae]|uniref:NUDIX hydrolase n=1 Tax=Microbacterium betulae TaxID=2981139 RepID=A0AA97FF98_9MICO|nr:NUDIX hydrolase [Microbacterium sp. AB]WOF21955.1 NUDIX hydrolase [Microbacterium sp. AB]
MTSVPPRPPGPRDPGDAWVVAETGERYWGRFGAAGLLAFDPERGVLLQHRVGWSHHGGTWALPGGALHEGEGPLLGAIRESQEEAGVPDGAVVPRFTHVYDVGVWRYTTVVADVAEPFEPVISDPESLELAWVAPGDIDDLPLHPGFAAAWPLLRSQLAVRPAVLIDAANVVGSVPDGWWRDREGAAVRLRDRIASLASTGLPAEALSLVGEWWFPGFELVVEGVARGVHGADGVRVVAADGSGDDALVRRAASDAEDGLRVTAVTSDRELRGRLEGVGARVVGTRWLLDLLG